MIRISRLILVLSILVLSGCASNPKIFTDFDKDQNFNAYKSFAWLDDAQGLVSGTYPVSGLSQQRIANEIIAELQSKGFAYVDSQSEADFLVSFTLGARDKIKIRKEIEYRIDPNSWRWGRVYYPYYYLDLQPVAVDHPYQFTEGSIAIDIFDQSARRPIWHAHASKKLSNSQLEGSKESASEAVKQLLADFPPLAGDD